MSEQLFKRMAARLFEQNREAYDAAERDLMLHGRFLMRERADGAVEHIPLADTLNDQPPQPK